MPKVGNEKTDCLFIHVPNVLEHDARTCTYFVNLIAMGIFSMSNELKKNGYNPEIINLGVEKSLDVNFDIAEYVKDNNINIIGISLHWHYQTYDSLLVASHIKKVNPDVKIFFGGLMSSAFAETILKDYPEVDFVIKGEGEKPVVSLVSRVIDGNKNFSNIPNLYWKDDKQKIYKNEEIWFANEEELNSYDFDGLEYLKNYETYLSFPMNYKKDYVDSESNRFYEISMFVGCLGRGCSGNCAWCGGGFEAVKCITGRDCVTIRDPQVVADEFIKMKNKYNIDLFYICFDPYPKNQDYLVKLFEIFGSLVPGEMRISFECFGLPTKEFVDAFAKNLNKNSSIIISPELGDEQMRFRHKAFGFTDDQFLNCMGYIISKKIPVELYFIELPFEDQNSKTKTTNMVSVFLVKSRTYNIKVYHQPFTCVEPYSPMALNPEKYNLKPTLVNLEDYVRNSKAYRDFI